MGMMRVRPLVVALVAGVLACHRRAPIHVESTEVRTGDDVVVTIDRDLDGRAADRYWLTLQSAEAPESDAIGRVLVERGERVVRLHTSAPGTYEVRLHDRYPSAEYHLVARVPVRVDGYAVQTGAQLDPLRR